MDEFLKEKMKKMAMDYVLDLDPFSLETNARENKDIINFLYSSGVLKSDEVRSTLDTTIKKWADRGYKMIQEGSESDHLGILSSAIAYLLEKKLYSKKDARFIVKNAPDHTIADFIELCGIKDFPGYIEKILRDPPVPQEYSVPESVCIHD